MTFTTMLLTGKQKEILKEGIIGAYREGELEILLSEKMDLRYSPIARGEDYISRVAFLVEKLEADGAVEQLIRVVVEKKPNSPYLAEVKTEFENILSQPASPKKNIPSNLKYRGSEHFVGRDEVLNQIGKRLEQNSQLAIYAVSGMGGIGKTELAIQYALRNQEEYSGGLCWLDCRSGDLGTQIVLYARSHLKLTIPEDLKELAEQVKYCWQNWPTGKVLLVYDDAGDYQSVDTYLPPPTETRFKVLLTSRQKLLDEKNRLDLDVLSPETALKLLQALVKNGRIEAQEEKAKALCAWLGYLPLAIELVGSYLQLDPLLSVTKAQEQLKESSLNAPLLEDQGFSGSVAQKGVAAAFELSWEKLSPTAQEMGCRLSLFAPAPIDWSWVEQCYPSHEIYDMATVVDMKQNVDRKEEYQEFKISVHQYLNDINEQEVSLREVDQEIEKWIKQWHRDKQNREKIRNIELFGRNLIQVSQDDQKYRLHPLIREFFVLKLQESLENIDDWKQDLCRVMVEIAKQIPSTVTLEVIESTTSYIPHLRELGENLTEWIEDEDLILPFVGLGRIYEGQSQFTEAEKWYKQSVKVARDRLGDSRSELRLGERHPDVATSYNNLAGLYESMGRYEEALPLYQQALEILLEQLGERHPDVASSYNNLALLYYSMGRYEEALPLYQQALEIRLEQLGERHPDVATSYNNLAGLYESMGRYEEALPLYQQALEIRLEQLGERHPLVANSYNNLANLYRAMGRYEEALPLFQQALEIYLEQLGERHPSVATSYNNLAELYESMGRYEEALPLYQQALEIWLEQLGERHPDVASSYNNLAGLYESMGRYEEAEQLFKKTLTLRLEILPENHPEIMQSYWWLATIASRQENYEEAIAHYQQALNIAMQVLGEEHPRTKNLYNSYITILLEAPTEEILKAFPEEMQEGYLQWRGDWEKQKEQR